MPEPDPVGFKGLTYGIRCECPWWRKAFDWLPLLGLDRFHDESKHTRIPIVPSRYAPGTVVAPETPIDYAALEQAYCDASDASWGSGSDYEPNLGIASLLALARIRASKTNETIDEAKQWLIANSELVDVDGMGRMYRLGDETSALLFYPEAE